MTPAINLVKKRRIEHRVHEYSHDRTCESYGLEAAQKLGVAVACVFKTLVVSLDTAELAVAVVPVATTLNLKQVAKACGAKKAAMADKQLVQQKTGYVLGGVSPLAQKKRLLTIVDASAFEHPTIFVSAGRRGLEIELDPHDLLNLTGGKQASIGHSTERV